MIWLVIILTFIFNACCPEAVLGSEIKSADPQPAMSRQIDFDKSLNAFYNKKWKKAEEGFDAIIKAGEEPWSSRSIFMLGRTYLKTGKRQEAKDLFLKAVTEYDELAEYSLYYLSESLLADKDYEEAIETLRLLYKTYPESPLKEHAQFKEAESLYLSDEYGEAIKAFEIFIAENPRSPKIPDAKFYKGHALKEAGMIKEAKDIFRKLWIEHPASASADKAEEELGDLKLDANDYLLRAENLFKAYCYSKALRDFQKAMELEKDPMKINEIRIRSGMALFKSRRYDEAIDVFNKVLSKEVEVKGRVAKEALYYLAISCLRTGKKDRFFKASYELYRLYPEDKKTPELLLIVSDELRRSGDREKALETYDLIIKEYPEISADALYKRGWMAYLSGDFEKSNRDMRAIVEGFPGSKRVAQALYWEARGYDKSGNVSKAEAIYHRIVREYTSTYYGHEARKRLDISEKPINSSIKENIASLTDCAVLISEISFPKVEELKILGMKKEAVAELDYIRDKYSDMALKSNNSNKLESLIKIAEAYIILGEYRIAISMAETHSRKEKRLIYFSYPLGFWSSLTQSSDETMIDPYFLAALIREESRFDAKAVSRAGAKGLMQVIPSTWDWISRQRHKTGIHTSDSKVGAFDPFDPGENIARGSWYLRYLFDKFNKNLIVALSAYNAGPDAANLWIKNGPQEPDEFIEEIPYPETRAYVKRVLRSYGEYKKIYSSKEKDLK